MHRRNERRGPTERLTICVLDRAVDNHHPSPANQQVSSGSSGGRRSERTGGANRDIFNAANSFASASGSPADLIDHAHATDDRQQRCLFCPGA